MWVTSSDVASNAYDCKGVDATQPKHQSEEAVYLVDKMGTAVIAVVSAS